MRSHHIATIGLIGLLAVLAVGCAKMSAEQEANVRKAFGVPADMPMKDLGEVELRAGIPKRVRLGAGKDCTITATKLTNRTSDWTFCAIGIFGVVLAYFVVRTKKNTGSAEA